MRSTIKYAILTGIAAYSFVLCVSTPVSGNARARGVEAYTRGQSEKDRRTFDSLERELRKELDELLNEPEPKKVVEMEGTNLAVHTSYDRFKDETTSVIELPLRIQLRALTVDANTHVLAGYSYAGPSSTKSPSSITLMLKTYGIALFGDNPSLIVLADGKRIRLGNMQQTVDFYSGRVSSETESVQIAYDVFALIANSDLVEVQIGQIEFALSEFHLRGFRKIAGLPDKARSNGNTAVTSTPSVPTIAETLWKGEKLSGEFKRDGTVLLEGFFGERKGTWHEGTERIEIELPSAGPTAAKVLGIAIVRGQKMALKFKTIGLFGIGSVAEILTMKIAH